MTYASKLSIMLEIPLRMLARCSAHSFNINSAVRSKDRGQLLCSDIYICNIRRPFNFEQPVQSIVGQHMNSGFGVTMQMSLWFSV